MSTVAVPAVSRTRRARLVAASDERLAQRVAGGDEQALAVIYERHHQALFRYCRSILRHDTDAQDALQSTFERALPALRDGRRNAPVRPWLFRIAHNEAITVIRRRLGDPPELGSAAHAVSAEQEAEQRARLATLVDDLGDLPLRARSALVMRELSELSHEEIAVALGITVGAAKQAIFEARHALHEAAEGRAMACEEIRRRISDGDRRALRGRRIRAHLRDCGGCAAFAAAIPQRRAGLHAVIPGLPPAAAAAILTRALASSSGPAAAGAGLGAAGGGLGTTGGIAGKGVLAAALGSKAVACVAVVATAVAGAGGVAAVVHLGHGATRAPRARHVAAAAVGVSALGHARRAPVAVPGRRTVLVSRAVSSPRDRSAAARVARTAARQTALAAAVTTARRVGRSARAQGLKGVERGSSAARAPGLDHARHHRGVSSSRHTAAHGGHRALQSAGRGRHTTTVAPGKTSLHR